MVVREVFRGLQWGLTVFYGRFRGLKRKSGDFHLNVTGDLMGFLEALLVAF